MYRNWRKCTSFDSPWVIEHLLFRTSLVGLIVDIIHSLNYLERSLERVLPRAGSCKQYYPCEPFYEAKVVAGAFACICRCVFRSRNLTINEVTSPYTVWSSSGVSSKGRKPFYRICTLRVPFSSTCFINLNAGTPVLDSRPWEFNTSFSNESLENYFKFFTCISSASQLRRSSV